MSLLLKNGYLLSPASGLDEPGDLLIEDGVIKEIGGAIEAAASEVFDCSGLVISPGLIDMHVHLREPGHEYKETIASGTAAAAAGGFTAVAAMPNTLPVNDNGAVAELILEKARQAGWARVHPVGAVTPGLSGVGLTEMGELKEAGCVAVSDDGRPVPDSRLLRRAMEYAAGVGLPVLCHSEDLALAKNGAMNEGPVSTKLGLAGIPWAAEVICVMRDIELAALTKAAVHICHVSCAGSVEAVRRAKERGVTVTCETAPHYFSLTDQAVIGYDTHAKMNPPLRSEADRRAILAGLADGTIDAIATDHAPHSPLEKEVEFDLALNGVIGLETALGLTLELVDAKIITPGRAVELLSGNPARILGLAAGTLAQGAAGDVTVIDTGRPWRVEPGEFLSKSRNTPFAGRTLPGRAVLTICGGKVTHRILEA